MAKDNPPADDPEQLRKILIVREHARADAWLRRDRRELEALLAPDYTEVSSLGRFDRRELLDTLFPAVTLHEFVMDEPVIRTSSGAAAVISYRSHESFTFNGKRTDGSFRVTATYTFDNKQYRLSSRTSTPLPE
jgi:hypothetical protein